MNDATITSLAGAMRSAGLRGALSRRWARVAAQRPVRLPLARPVVSFSFDDVPRSACLVASQLLQARGVRGTYYICTGLTGLPGAASPEPHHSWDDLLGLHQAGHQLACHGRWHVDAQALNEGQLLRDTSANVQALQARGLLQAGAPVDFAYPFGCVNARAKRNVALRYRSARGVQPGPHVGMADLNLLRGTALYAGPGAADQALGWIDRTVRSQGWLIFFTHGVSASPGPFDATPQLLSQVLDHALARGCEVLTVDQVLSRCGA
jgi:peptidoglycan/xylan/chitin deacetylase (PgdA/CDA1 family)